MKRRPPPILSALLLSLGLCGTAEAHAHGVELAFAFSMPLLIVGWCFHSILKQRYLKEIYLKAIEKGIAVPPMPEQGDVRRTALVLIALGLGFAIAASVTLSVVTRGPHPLQVGIWGIIPILMGLALLYHKFLKDKEKETSQID